MRSGTNILLLLEVDEDEVQTEKTWETITENWEDIDDNWEGD